MNRPCCGVKFLLKLPTIIWIVPVKILEGLLEDVVVLLVFPPFEWNLNIDTGLPSVEDVEDLFKACQQSECMKSRMKLPQCRQMREWGGV